jgi:hypothetical protein
MESPPFFAAARILEASNGPNRPKVLSHALAAEQNVLHTSQAVMPAKQSSRLRTQLLLQCSIQPMVSYYLTTLCEDHLRLKNMRRIPVL